MRIFWIFIISFLLAACATDNYYAQALNSWHGNNLSTLFKVWGAPDQVLPIPNGNTYYIYNSQSVQSAPGPYVPSFFAYNNPGSGNKAVVGTVMLQSPPTLYVLSCRTWFEVDKNSNIINAGAKGNYCYAGEDNIRGIASPAFKLPQSSQAKAE